MLQLLPRFEFEQAAKRHRSDYSAKGFSSWGQFVAMLFCQLGRAHSLREICGGLAGCEGKLKHLGLSDFPKRSTLACANAHSPWSLYRTVFEQLLAQCQLTMAAQSGRKKFRFKNKREVRIHRSTPIGIVGKRYRTRLGREDNRFLWEGC